jgi:hypothetical protein
MATLWLSHPIQINMLSKTSEALPHLRLGVFLWISLRIDLSRPVIPSTTINQILFFFFVLILVGPDRQGGSVQ